MIKRPIPAALVLGIATMSTAAEAQQRGPCLPRDVLIATLEDRFSETLVGGGLRNAQQLVEVWSSPETGSFTVFITHPNGVSCVMATGQNWQIAVAAPAEGVAG